MDLVAEEKGESLGVFCALLRTLVCEGAPFPAIFPEPEAKKSLYL